MATISITVPDPVVQRVLDAVAATYGYDPDTDGTKAQFARAQVAAVVKNVVVSYEAQQAGESAWTAAKSTAEGDINPS
jgi:hypothetical protein